MPRNPSTTKQYQAVTTANWQKCVQALRGEISQGQFNTWIRPLSAELEPSGKLLWVKAPNRFILDWVSSRFMPRIRELVLEFEPGIEDVALEVAPPRPTAEVQEVNIAEVNTANASSAVQEATPRELKRNP